MKWLKFLWPYKPPKKQPLGWSIRIKRGAIVDAMIFRRGEVVRMLILTRGLRGAPSEN